MRRERQVFEGPSSGGAQTSEHAFEYEGDAELPSAIVRVWRGDERRARSLPDRSRPGLVVERDARGRPAVYHFLDPEDPDRVDVTTVARDGASRIVSVTSLSRGGFGYAIELTRDARGVVVAEMGTETRDERILWRWSLTRTFDASGRILRAEATQPLHHEVASEDGEIELGTTSATYGNGEACSPDVVVEQELDLLPTLDDHLDYAP